MRSRSCLSLAVAVVLLSLTLFSCGEKADTEQEKAEAPEQEGTVSYISEEISFGIFFDEEGTKRTVKLDRGQKELSAYIIVQAPDSFELAAAQWMLKLPEGLEVGIDKYNKHRVMTLGQMEGGISERFKPCLMGPKVLIHELVLEVTGELKNAEISILPAPDGNFLGVAGCDEAFTQKRASSYKAVVNPD